MISVNEALTRILADLPLMPSETVSVGDAHGRVLAADVVARVTQPPADVSAMDGYAVRAADVAAVPATLWQIGVAPAGGAFGGRVGTGEAVRIFTGGPVPDGADTIVIQEDVDADGDEIVVREGAPKGRYIRKQGLDFSAGEVGLEAGRRLSPPDIGLAAAMNVPWLEVRRRPRVALLATGDEIVRPGEAIGPNQIVSSNSLAMAALVRRCGGEPIDLGIARDNEASLRALAAGAQGADMLVTLGGASVGEHDLVRKVLGDQGLDLAFWRIAMRPGKPLMFGHLGGTTMMGMPGNPVSSLVCGMIFLRPAIDKMLGRPAGPAQRESARLGRNLAENDRREDYLRAILQRNEHGDLVATPFDVQDSSMLSRLSKADCLIVRPPHAPAAAKNDRVEIIRLD